MKAVLEEEACKYAGRKGHDLPSNSQRVNLLGDLFENVSSVCSEQPRA